MPGYNVVHVVKADSICMLGLISACRHCQREGWYEVELRWKGMRHCCMKGKDPRVGQGGKDNKGGQSMPQDHQPDSVPLGKGSGKKGYLEGGKDGKGGESMVGAHEQVGQQCDGGGHGEGVEDSD